MSLAILQVQGIVEHLFYVLSLHSTKVVLNIDTAADASVTANSSESSCVRF